MVGKHEAENEGGGEGVRNLVVTAKYFAKALDECHNDL